MAWRTIVPPISATTQVSFVFGALAATAISAKAVQTNKTLFYHPSMYQGKSVPELCCPSGVCSEAIHWFILPPDQPSGCPNAAKLSPKQFAERANADDGGANAFYSGGNVLDLFNKESGGFFNYDGEVFEWSMNGGDAVKYAYEQNAGPNKDGYKLWKLSCESTGCPGIYLVYMGCEGHFGQGGTGPKCYLHFYCKKSNTDEDFDDC